MTDCSNPRVELKRSDSIILAVGVVEALSGDPKEVLTRFQNLCLLTFGNMLGPDYDDILYRKIELVGTAKYKVTVRFSLLESMIDQIVNESRPSRTPYSNLQYLDPHGINLPPPQVNRDGLFWLIQNNIITFDTLNNLSTLPSVRR